MLIIHHYYEILTTEAAVITPEASDSFLFPQHFVPVVKRIGFLYNIRITSEKLDLMNIPPSVKITKVLRFNDQFR